MGGSWAASWVRGSGGDCFHKGFTNVGLRASMRKWGWVGIRAIVVSTGLWGRGAVWVSIRRQSGQKELAEEEPGRGITGGQQINTDAFKYELPQF